MGRLLLNDGVEWRENLMQIRVRVFLGWVLSAVCVCVCVHVPATRSELGAHTTVLALFHRSKGATWPKCYGCKFARENEPDAALLTARGTPFGFCIFLSRPGKSHWTGALLKLWSDMKTHLLGRAQIENVTKFQMHPDSTF